MINGLLNKIKNFFSGDKRTVKAKKNIFYSFLIKALNILVYLLIVPITLTYLNKYEYGVWLTLSSVLMWINMFDIGLGNGLRNKLAESLAQKNIVLSKIYVSTTFFALIFLMLIVFLVFLFLNKYCDWESILSIQHGTVLDLNLTVVVSFALFCITFIFKIVGNVFLADQRTAVNNVLQLVSNIISLLIIYTLTFFKKGSLFEVALIYSLSPAIVYILTFFYVFYFEYKLLSPSIKHFRRIYLKDLMSLGAQFFIIQIASVIIFTSTNIIISHLFGPAEVTPYNIAYKYFSVIPMIFGIIIAPMWSASTEAYVNNDYVWIKKSMSKLIKLYIFSNLILLFMVALSGYIYKFWVGDDIIIPFSLSCALAIYTSIYNYCNIYSTFIFGIGKIRLQLYNAIIMAVVYVPLAITLSNYFGVVGIVVAMSLSIVLNTFTVRIQFNKLLTFSAEGLWNK